MSVLSQSKSSGDLLRKSSKKRKADAAEKTKLRDESTKSTLPAEYHEDGPPAAKKRKASIVEIEVDVTAPEPPSKKALRQMKKGLVVSKDAAGAVHDDGSPGLAKDDKAQPEKRSEHGVWIGNLNWCTSKEELRSFITGNSQITSECITRIHMPAPKENGPKHDKTVPKGAKKFHNKGFAYVDFSKAEHVTEAIALSEQLLGGRRLLIKNSKSFEGRPEKERTSGETGGKPANERVFVGNLSFDATEELVREHFARCGAVQSVKLATFEDSGKCKGYGWIVFEDIEAARSAVRGFIRTGRQESADEGEEEEEAAPEPEKPRKPELESQSEPASEHRDPLQAKTKAKTRRSASEGRKIWLNRIAGRTLRMEFAEDAQTRYKKRYGKDGSKQGQNQSRDGQGVVADAEAPEV